MSNNTSLIGKIKSSRFPYYDSKTRAIRFKNRPVLILNIEKETGFTDLTVLPVSSITIRKNVDKKFDLEIKSSEYPLLELSKEVSYIRCGKLTTINSKDLGFSMASDLKSHYPKLWSTIIDNVKLFINGIR